MTCRSKSAEVCLEKTCSENMLQVYRRIPMPKSDFNKGEIQLWYECSPANSPHIFKTLFLRTPQ